MSALSSAPVSPPAARSQLRSVVSLLALTAAYFAAGKLGLSLAYVNASASAVWPSTGIALAAFLLLGNFAWPAIFAGAFLVNVTTTGSVATSLGIATGNTLEAALGAFLVCRFAGGRHAFERPGDIFRFVVVMLLATTVSATIGPTSLSLGGFASWSDYESIWLTWWLGDLTGAVIVAPLVLLWTAEPGPRWSRRRLLEAAAMVLATVLVGQIVFGRTLSLFGVPNYPLGFLCLPLLVWPAFRFGPREAATLVVVLSGFAIDGTLRGFGPFATGRENESLLLLQAFMGTIAVTALSVAALVRERASAEENEKELREAAELERARLAAVVRHMPMGVIMAEAPSGKLILGNDQVERIWGRPFARSDSIASYDAYQGFHEDGRRYAPDEWPLARSIRTGEVVLGEEIVFRRGDGTRGTMSASSAPIRDARGRIAAAVVIFHDVSEAKDVERARAELLALEQEARAGAEAASRAKDQFLAMVGHELRNPLGAIVSGVEVLDHVDNSNEQALRARGAIWRQVGHLTRLVDDLMDIARVVTGKIELRQEPVDLAETASRCVSTLTLGDRGDTHSITVDLEPVWVHGDPVRLEQVIVNLLTNALRYTPSGGEIHVSVKRLANEASFQVRDTGVGMGPDMLDHVFDLFVQGERPLDRSQGGLGVGLTLVRRLVELQGGKVEAASDGPGRGSVFTIRLPAISPPEPAADGPGPAESRTSRRVLIVEDNEDGLEMLRAVLELSGHEVHTARNGPDGVRAAQLVEPAVALVDIGLPGFDGYEVARRIRSHPGGPGILLVALTGYGQPEDRRRAGEAGFDAHLVKPVDPRQLEAVLAVSPAGKTS